MIKDEKIKCSICGAKERRDPELGYRAGYYKIDLPIAKRKVTYQVCSKCNRCFIAPEEIGLNFENGPKSYRKVYIRGSDD